MPVLMMVIMMMVLHETRLVLLGLVSALEFENDPELVRLGQQGRGLEIILLAHAVEGLALPVRPDRFQYHRVGSRRSRRPAPGILEEQSVPRRHIGFKHSE